MRNTLLFQSFERGVTFSTCGGTKWQRLPAAVRRLEASATFFGFPDGLNWPLPLHASKVTPFERMPSLFATARQAFTLIEVMIVISIMAIAINGMFGPIRQIFGWIRTSEGELYALQAATDGFLLMKEAMRQTSSIQCRNAGEVICEGGSVKLIRRLEGGTLLEFEKGGGTVRLKLGDGFKMGPFQPVDGQNFWCPIFMKESRFPMFWRCGQ